MNLNSVKLKLIEKVIKTNNAELLETILDALSQESGLVKETQASYGTKEDEPIDITTLSPAFQESIRIGLEQSDRGEGISDEEDKKYWEQWFKEN